MTTNDQKQVQLLPDETGGQEDPAARFNCEPVMSPGHKETHRTQHTGWLRAAVLGANDGIVSTASLVIGVAASNATHNAILIAGAAGLVAGAMSMAAGEYVSVSSQSDTENADIERERKELFTDNAREVAEVADIYRKRGLDAELAAEVAQQLMAKDALAGGGDTLCAGFGRSVSVEGAADNPGCDRCGGTLGSALAIRWRCEPTATGAFLIAMILHRSGVVVTSERAELSNPRACDLPGPSRMHFRTR